MAIDLSMLPPALADRLAGLTPFARMVAEAMILRHPEKFGLNQPAQQAAPPQNIQTGGPNPPMTGNPFLQVRTGGPQPARPLPTAYTGGPLPPTQTVPRAGGLLPHDGGVDAPYQRPAYGTGGVDAPYPRPNVGVPPAYGQGNTGIVPPGGPRPMAQAAPQAATAPGMPVAQAMTQRAVSNTGLPAQPSQPTGRPSLLRMPRLG